MSAAPIQLAARSLAMEDSPDSCPPLENGDRLTRIEFERRYNRMPHVNKAELIEGIVYMPSPVRINKHATPHVWLSAWLWYYTSNTPGLHNIGDNGTVRLDEDNAPQPDLFLMLPQSAGGSAKIDADDYVSGAPELICEIAASSASIDLNQKLNAYRRNGVREYLVWRTRDRAIDWFVSREGRFDLQTPDPAGILRSEVFPGLWLDVPAILSFDRARLLAAVDTGIATPEHAAFVHRLQSNN